ncbi:leukocyte receptor cluster member 1 homolog isoform X2 [Zingiber officinale]|uniref:leukocyte receptor cluster member 1 homolog isoform X2 n=1 Tax=Zingiber officinale TaxID=94328 RepID=UPI001C4BB668|nr:leukocyte receptor cluster member 1 homolog isoform X2 [Zingiber officinale]
MGGHGGLNILPQKRWNVYNYDNREKVRKDEEAAAREEQLQREQSRRRDAEFRLDRLRVARGIHHQQPTPVDDSHHFNLFEGLSDFSALGGARGEEATHFGKRSKKSEAEDSGTKSFKRQKREERSAPVAPEDEKYKLGYGLVGKGVKAPWYLSAPSTMSKDADEKNGISSVPNGSAKKNSGKKTIEELREERMTRENKEKERERALHSGARNRGFSRTFK